MRTPQEPSELHADEIEALYLMVTRGTHHARKGYFSKRMRGLLRAGYAVATSNTTAEITVIGRAAYAAATEIA